jgi:hypothetical protein
MSLGIKFFLAQMKVNSQVPGKRGGQTLLLKLQLPPKIMPIIDFCFPWNFRAHFYVEVGSTNLHVIARIKVVGFANFFGTWKCALKSSALQHYVTYKGVISSPLKGNQV